MWSNLRKKGKWSNFLRQTRMRAHVCRRITFQNPSRNTTVGMNSSRKQSPACPYSSASPRNSCTMYIFPSNLERHVPTPISTKRGSMMFCKHLPLPTSAASWISSTESPLCKFSPAIRLLTHDRSAFIVLQECLRREFPANFSAWAFARESRNLDRPRGWIELFVLHSFTIMWLLNKRDLRLGMSFLFFWMSPFDSNDIDDVSSQSSMDSPVSMLDDDVASVSEQPSGGRQLVRKLSTWDWSSWLDIFLSLVVFSSRLMPSVCPVDSSVITEGSWFMANLNTLSTVESF